MKLRVFLPASDSLDASARLAWMLFDSRQELLRQDASTLADMPRADEVEAVLPAERVLFARLKLPKVGAATIRELLPYAVEDRLLADPAHIHAVAGPTSARGETVVAVVDRDWLQRMVQAMARAGHRPSKAWSESALLAGGKGDWHVVVGPSRGMLVDDDGVSATFDPSSAVPLALRVALDEASARGERPQAIRVHAEGGAPLPDLDRWSGEAGLPFSPGTQWEAIARGRPGTQSIDLLKGELGQDEARPGLVPRAAVALLAVILGLQLAFSALQSLELRRERDDLERRREAVFREAFPEAKAVVDPDLQMARNLAELKRARGLAAGDDFLAQMTRAAREARPVKVVEYADGRLVTR
ncbi:MAG TPA: type II secretion system protein GspL [Usitatibacter sp.]|nr:type II secretion system protein GspL [Usitatibacter sp.]